MTSSRIPVGVPDAHVDDSAVITATDFLQRMFGTEFPTADQVLRMHPDEGIREQARVLAASLSILGNALSRAGASHPLRLITDLYSRLAVLAEGSARWQSRSKISEEETEIRCHEIIINRAAVFRCITQKVGNQQHSRDKTTDGLHLHVQLRRNQEAIHPEKQRQGWVGDSQSFRAYYERVFGEGNEAVERHVQGRIWDHAEMHDFACESSSGLRENGFALTIIAQSREGAPVFFPSSPHSFRLEGSARVSTVVKCHRALIQALVMQFLRSPKNVECFFQ